MELHPSSSLRSIPSIHILPKMKQPSKVVPELPLSSTLNSSAQHNSTALQPPNSLMALLRRKSSHLDGHSESSDKVIFDEFKHVEISQARSHPNSKYPYWFIDAFDEVNDLGLNPLTDDRQIGLFPRLDPKNQAQWAESMSEILQSKISKS